MVNEERYCLDILAQLSAVRSGLNVVGMELFRMHISGCVRKKVENHHEENVMQELAEVIKKYVE